MASRYNIKVQYAAWMAAMTLATVVVMTTVHSWREADEQDTVARRRAGIAAQTLAKAIAPSVVSSNIPGMAQAVELINPDKEIDAELRKLGDFELKYETMRLDYETLDLKIRQRKGLHHYHYLMHPQFGLCHVRVQTWVPFQVKVSLNGREWLARQMKAAGIGFVKR